MEPTMGSLVDRVRSGDREAFALFVERYGLMVLRTARLIVRDPDLAEDVCQETFLKCWRRIGALKDENPAPWLNRIAANEAISAWRRRNRLQGLRERIGFFAGAGGDTRIEDRLDLGRALDRIKVEERAVVVLHYYQDLSVEDTALALGIPVDTVKSRLKAALRRLREMTRDEEQT
ncbi:MAG TPA: SigE family RNA polymerase sigma factor [Candidatus Dormibacteraeota bacterium]|nr:SigE family RNA polymerase sigma factor [Candidatus Dormibacteraeota bacterium]